MSASDKNIRSDLKNYFEKYVLTINCFKVVNIELPENCKLTQKKDAPEWSVEEFETQEEAFDKVSTMNNQPYGFGIHVEKFDI